MRFTQKEGEMIFHGVNLLAVLAAGVSAFVIGGIWYSSLVFGRVWKSANQFREGQPKSSPGKTFSISFVLSIIMALNLAFFLNDPKTTVVWGATAGFLAGFGWVAMGIGIVSLFEGRPFKYVLVNGGYLTIALVAMGAILGAWR
jgi:membrane-associated HD superfamily phosphohydrolase